jgi:hypothetical protein
MRARTDKKQRRAHSATLSAGTSRKRRGGHLDGSRGTRCDLMSAGMLALNDIKKEAFIEQIKGRRTDTNTTRSETSDSISTMFGFKMSPSSKTFCRTSAAKSSRCTCANQIRVHARIFDSSSRPRQPHSEFIRAKETGGLCEKGQHEPAR